MNIMLRHLGRAVADLASNVKKTWLCPAWCNPLTIRLRVFSVMSLHTAAPEAYTITFISGC